MSFKKNIFWSCQSNRISNSHRKKNYYKELFTMLLGILLWPGIKIYWRCGVVGIATKQLPISEAKT